MGHTRFPLAATQENNVAMQSIEVVRFGLRKKEKGGRKNGPTLWQIGFSCQYKKKEKKLVTLSGLQTVFVARNVNTDEIACAPTH